MIDDTYPPLAAWLGGDRVAELAFDGARGVHLAYTDAAIQRYGLNGLALSASLPVRTSSYLPADTAPYLDRLLPEGAARSLIERQFGVPRGDTFHLLEAIGRDCAGAVVIVDAEDAPPGADSAVMPMTVDQVEGRLADLPVHPLGVDARVRLSLAGMQAKLLLARLPDGQYALPIAGAPSTHILKPPIERFPDVCANEAWCLALARYAGLRAASAAVERFGHREALVVERYDRQVAADGAVERVHQEDCCQALGVPVPAKYQHDTDGPTLRSIAQLLRRLAAAPTKALTQLVEAVAFAAAIGNADLHGRNLSIVYGVDGPELAPIYDAVATVTYDGITSELALYVGDARSVESVTAADVVAEARSWGVPAARASRLVDDTLERLIAGVDDATAEVPVAERVATVVRQRLRSLTRA